VARLPPLGRPVSGDDDDPGGFLGFVVHLAIESGPTATAALGGLFGALVLGAAGNTADRGERWERVVPDRLRVSVVPLRTGRVGLGAAISF
jgi:hypothetical protein